jgi:hypothetical protein
MRDDLRKKAPPDGIAGWGFFLLSRVIASTRPPFKAESTKGRVRVEEPDESKAGRREISIPANSA